jgi:omega-hydroxy-beta-dihydromenaquinone-9 sulfotransferase
LKNSYLTAGITFHQLIRLLQRNKISWHPKYLIRIFFLFQSACWSSLFAFIEKKQVGKKIDSLPPVRDPIFIIGHWRTGTTFLHKLMSLHPDLTVPTLYDVAIPDSCLTSYPYYSRFMRLMVSKQRPMDKVKLGIQEPQEDEYALFRLTGFSPLERLIFPKRSRYFLLDHPSYLPENTARDEWRNKIMLFFKKLHFKSGKRIVSKNPFNSMRIPELLSLFPDACFIHICRHPFDVVPSTQHMFEIVQRQNILNAKSNRPTIEEVSLVLKEILDRIRSDVKVIPTGRFYQIKYEDLESNPLKSLEHLFVSLGIPVPVPFIVNIEKYLAEINDFEKNKFTLSNEEMNCISRTLKDQMEYLGY